MHLKMQIIKHGRKTLKLMRHIDASSTISIQSLYWMIMYDTNVLGVCLVLSESNGNTKAVNNYNSDGSKDWGLFQINDRYWCKNGYRGGGCNVDCQRKYRKINVMPHNLH